MLEQNFQKALALVASRLNGKANWRLIASANLALQELKVDPEDLDILVDHEDKDIVLKNFSDFDISQPKLLANSEAEHSNIILDGVEVEFCFEKSRGKYYPFLNSQEIYKAMIEGTEISALTLEDEMKAYALTGRQEKTKMIREFIKHRN